MTASRTCLKPELDEGTLDKGKLVKRNPDETFPVYLLLIDGDDMFCL